MTSISGFNKQIDSYGITNFIKFLDKHNIINYAIAAIMSEKINEMTSTFVNSVVTPLINNDKNGYDTKKLEDQVITYNGYSFKIGRFVFVFLKFVITIYIIYLLSKILRNFT